MGRTSEELPETVLQSDPCESFLEALFPIEMASTGDSGGESTRDARLEQLEVALIAARRTAHNLNNILTAIYCHHDLLPQSLGTGDGVDPNYVRLKELFAAAAAEVGTLSEACRKCGPVLSPKTRPIE